MSGRGKGTATGLRALALAAALAPGAGGCYQYVPVPLAAARPEEELRVRVTDAAGARLVRELGTYTTQLDGWVTPAAGAAGDSVAVAVAIGRDYRGVTLESVRQTLFLGRSEVVEVRRRELSRGRTAATTAGALAGFALLVGTVIQLGDDNPPGEGPPPPPPPAAVRVHVRIPLRLPIP